MSRFIRATLLALVVIISIAAPTVGHAASGPNIKVQIEGTEATLVEQRDVALDYNKFAPPAPWPGSTAPANSIGAAIETALNDTYGTPAPTTPGWWDREPFVSTVKSETLIWPQYWAFFTNNLYVNKGAMDGGDQWGLDYGDELLISGGGSIGEWPEPSRPERLPVDLAGTGIDDLAKAVPVNAPFLVDVTAWMPQEGDTDMPPGPSNRQRASFAFPGDDFTVVATPADTLYDRNTVSGIEIGTAKTDIDGQASMKIERAGEALIKAVREDSTAPFGASSMGAQGRSEAHPVCVYELNSGDCGTPVFSPATSVDAGKAAVGSAGSPVQLEVAAPQQANRVNRVRVFGEDAADFLVSAGNCVDEFVPQGGKCRITVRLAPTATGDRKATLRVTSESESLPRDIALTGTGTPAQRSTSGPPKLKTSVYPGKGRVRRGGRVTITLRTKNVGDTSASDILTCLRPPAGFSVGQLCRKRVKLPAGSTAAFRFTVRANRSAILGKFRAARIQVTANGAKLDNLKVRLAARR